MLPALTSCSTEPGSFADAWADCYDDTKDVFGKSFLSSDPNDPYARKDGWVAQTGSGQERSSRLLLNSGVDEGTRVPRNGQGRNENAAGGFWDWLVDND
jgi:hypothetical protein